MSHADLMREWYSEVWEKGNTDAIDRYFAPDILTDGLIPEMQVGADEFRDLVMAFRNMFGVMEVTMPKIIEEGDWLSAIIHLRTTRADNGAPVNATGTMFIRFKDGYVVEAYNQFDFISLFEQLGQFPEDTLPICMTGQRLDWA